MTRGRLLPLRLEQLVSSSEILLVDSVLVLVVDEVEQLGWDEELEHGKPQPSSLCLMMESVLGALSVLLPVVDALPGVPLAVAATWFGVQQIGWRQVVDIGRLVGTSAAVAFGHVVVEVSSIEADLDPEMRRDTLELVQ